jgi:ribokinase
MSERLFNSERPRVVVVGSLNVDLIARVERLPCPGETVRGRQLLRRFGGKGANQAVAAARHGARVMLVGCVGRDADGAAYRRYLATHESIDVRGIANISGQPTGTALINVDERGENQIVVVAGANAKLSAARVSAQAGVIRRAQALLAQLEVPLPAVLEAMRLANLASVPVVFNPSPYRPDFPWGRVAINTVVVNEPEAEKIFGCSAAELFQSPGKWRARLLARRVSHLIVTRGAHPTLCLTAEDCFQVPGLRVKPVDTVGAGDAFAGVFAARLAEGCALADAVAFANCAGALATLKPGAQEAIPSRTAVQHAHAKLAQRPR